MSFSSFEDSVFEVLKIALPSLNVVIGYQNGPELATPYCTMYAATLDPVGREDMSTKADAFGDDFAVRTVQHYSGTIRFEFTGKDVSGNHGGDLATQWLQIISIPNIQLELRKRNLGFMGKSLIRRVPKLRETVWYNAYVIDVVFSFALETIQRVDIVDSVIIDSTYDSITTIVDSQTIPNP